MWHPLWESGERAQEMDPIGFGHIQDLSHSWRERETPGDFEHKGKKNHLSHTLCFITIFFFWQIDRATPSTC